MPTQNGLQVTTYGTRGSSPVSGPGKIEFGGNTTCIRVHSACLPKTMALVIDAGTGYQDATEDIMNEGILKVGLLHTHHHWDHIGGFPFGAHSFNPNCLTYIWGPNRGNKGPKWYHKKQMSDESFPVKLERIQFQVKFRNVDDPSTTVLVIHPKGGTKLMKIHQFKQLDVEDGQIRFTPNAFGKPGSYPISECLVVKMYETSHPDFTISYRFEERPTDKVFVFLTDHEVTATWSFDLVNHLRDADLLIQDCQYEESKYFNVAGGWGHGTPGYCANTAVRGNVKRLGLTHHDNKAKDEDIRARLAETKTELEKLERPDLAESCFACRDYETITV